MLTRSRSLIAAIVLTVMLVSAGMAQAAPAIRSQAPIRLKAATFTPTRGEAPAIPAGLTIAGYAQGQRGYYLVQFQGPVEQAWKNGLAAQGAELIDYVPDFAFKVRMTPAQARQAEGLAGVAWVGLFQPAYKLNPNVNRANANPLTVRIERGADAAAVAAQIATTGAMILGREGQMLMVAANSAQIDAIARVVDVAWVQNFDLWQKHDAYARIIIGANAANSSDGSAASRGYDGSTQIAAVADTGFGGGTTATGPLGIPASRVTAVYNWVGVTDSCFKTIINDGAVDVDSGHGTHVAGSVLSDGASSPAGPMNRGIAPGARLVFQATENYVGISNLCQLYGYTNGYYLTGLPSDLRQLFQQAYSAGARIHANSWGSAAAGDYTTNSVAADDFIWTHPDMTITFSAGNEGADANNDGVVDNDSIGAPATAKNVITIGASENDRQGNYQCDSSLTYTSHDTTYQSGQTCASMGGINQLGTPRMRWGFTANPIADDPTAGSQEQMAAFSSRGPTDDGRIKPDVVAPGTWILSSYSPMYREGYDASTNPRNAAYQMDGWGMPANGVYKYFGGTSMSNPIAAGAATVVRDYYKKAYTTDASAALVKATLINTAVDMGDENNDGVNDNDYPIPNVHEGWGRINLDAATSGAALFKEGSGIATNGNSTYTANANGGTLKVTLVWSDYASTDAATKNLVNDLDLTITAPNGTVYRGNNFSGGWSTNSTTVDRTNNVENVYVQSAASGTWTITVRGYNVPNGPQPFALVVSGASSLAGSTPPPTFNAPSSLTATVISKSQINLNWADNTTDETGFEIERCTGTGCTSFARIATVAADVRTFSNTGLTGNTSYTYRVRAVKTGTTSGYSNTVIAKTLRK